MQMALQMVMAPSLEQIPDLEQVLREEAQTYVKKIEHGDAISDEDIEEYRNFLKEKMDALGGLDVSNSFFDNAITGLREAITQFEQGQEKYRDKVASFEELEKQAFSAYRENVHTAFEQAWEVTAHEIVERNKEFSRMGDVSQYAENLQKLQDELKSLDEMKEQMQALGEHHSVVHAYHARRGQLGQKIKAIENVREATSDAIVYPIQINVTDENISLGYVVPKDDGELAQLIDRAILTTIRRMGFEPNFAQKDSLHHVLIGKIGGDITQSIDKELTKPEYDTLHEANVEIRYHTVASSGKQILETLKNVKENSYTMREAAEELGISRRTLDNLIYRHPEFKRYTIKEGEGKFARRVVTAEGLEVFREQFPQKSPVIEEEVVQDEQRPDALYTSADVLEELGITKGSFLHHVYRRKGSKLTKKKYSFKDGKKRIFTQEGLELFRQYVGGERESVARPRESSSRRQKRNRNEKVVEMHRDGMANKEIADKINLSSNQIGNILKKEGVLTPISITKNYNTLDAIRNANFSGVDHYSKEKDNMRTRMLEHMIDALSDPERIQYLGLEGPNFGSYFALADLSKIDVKRSLVPEIRRESYRMMESLVLHHEKIEGGEIFDGLNLYHGDISDALNEHPQKKFNFVNLDYMGYFSKSKKATIDNLFEKHRFMDEAVLFITLSNSELHRARLRDGSSSLPDEFEDGFKTDDQEGIVTKFITEFAPMCGYKATLLETKEYKSRRTPMLSISYKVEVKNDSNNRAA